MHEGLIITSNEMKNMILKNEGGLKKFKFFSSSKLKTMLYGSFKPSSVIFLQETYHFSIPAALEILKYLPLIDLNKTYTSLKLRDLKLIKENLIKNNYYLDNNISLKLLKRYPISFINPIMTKENINLIKRLKEITEVYIESTNRNYPLAQYYSYPNMESEAYNAFKKAKKIMATKPNANIYFLNVNEEYYPIFKRLSNSFKISINLKSSLSIISNEEIKGFLKGLNEGKSLESLLNEIKDLEIKNYLASIINDYELDSNKSYYDLFSYLIRNKSYKSDIYDRAINLGSIFNSYSDDDYLFLFNLNADFPSIVADSGYLADKDLRDLGLNTSSELNALNKEYIIRALESTKNLELSFPKRLGTKENILSDIAANLLEIKGSSKALGDSLIEDSLTMGALLDEYYLYNKLDPKIKDYSLKDLGYKEYDSRFKPFSEEFIATHTPELPIKMSYSNVKLYYSCPFHYYLDRILGLQKFEGTLATHIGSYAHEILEKSYLPDFDLASAKAEGKKELTKKEQFFASLMDEVIDDLLEFNQKHEDKMALKDTMCEAKISTINEEGKTDFDPDINFYGFIDKIKYLDDGNKVYLAIYDYKTGGDQISLNNVVDGDNLQLPSYLFLVNRKELFKNREVVVLGMYLQKVNVTLIDGLRDKREQREATFKLKGYSTNDRANLALLDPEYSDSTYIQSMKTLKDGSFSSYTKLYNMRAIDNLLKIVPDLLEKLKRAIFSFDFPILPLRIDNKSNSCRFCEYKKICYHNGLDYHDEKKKPFEDLLEEDYHGLD